MGRMGDAVRWYGLDAAPRRRAGRRWLGRECFFSFFVLPFFSSVFLFYFIFYFIIELIC